MKRYLIAFSTGWLLASLTIVAFLGWAVVRFGPEIYYEWNVFPYVPVCREFEKPFREEVFDQFRDVEGEPTREFWREIISVHRGYAGFGTKDWTNIAVVNDRLQVSASLHWTAFNPFLGLEEGDDPETFAAWPSRVAATRIFERRQKSGEITEETLRSHQVMQNLRGYTRPPYPDECGFMEELILKGGRFASE